MSDRPTLTPEQAEELRLAIKEGGWALNHLRKWYELTKPEGAKPVFEDPNQLSLFGEEDEK